MHPYSDNCGDQRGQNNGHEWKKKEFQKKLCQERSGGKSLGDVAKGVVYAEKDRQFASSINIVSNFIFGFTVCLFDFYRPADHKANEPKHKKEAVR